MLLSFLCYLFFLKLETKYKFNISDGFKCDVPFENLVEMNESPFYVALRSFSQNPDFSGSDGLFQTD
jgi:hypothetical protein